MSYFSFACSLPPLDDLPDAGEGMCCMGAAVWGPHRCTCWEPEYDMDQQELVPGHQGLRTEMCEDCAYRPHSPERQGDPKHAGDEEQLMDLVYSGQPFTCHQGIRRPLIWCHPSGATYPGHAANYDPPMSDGVPYKADGTPADICAGWAALWLKAQESPS